MTGAEVCLAIAIYFEAGGESLEGKVAVANTIINRVEDRRWPNTICGVVKQRHQFSFYWDGKPEKAPKDNTDIEAKAFQESVNVALAFLSEGSSGWHIKDNTNGATHYHGVYIETPLWASQLEKIKEIGWHVFYK